MSPMWINPALTGAIDGDYRVSGLNRSQWQNIDDGYVTKGLSFDAPTNKSIAFGGNITHMNASLGGYTYTNGLINIAYTGIKFGQEGFHHVNFGMNAGLINRRIDMSKLKFGSQWDSTIGFNPSIARESIQNNSTTVLDIGTGLVYYNANPDSRYNIYFGIAAAHLTQPKDNFLKSTDTTIGSNVPIRYTAHGGVRIQLRENVIIVPNFIYMRQNNAEEKMLGAYFQISANENTDFLVGANYRLKDAVVPYVGFTYNNFTIGASYDVTTSKLKQLAATNLNTFELTLSYIKRRNIKASPEYIHCPRL